MNQNQFLEVRGRLRVFAANRATVTVGTYHAQHQICQIAFNKDGSIFVQCPYFPGRHGILSAPTQDPEAKGPITYDLNEGGKLTSHLVKLDHHPDGRVHFSQDSKILTQVRRQSFTLPDSIGRIFQLHIYHPEGFERLTSFKKNRLYLPFAFTPGLPQALVVQAEWRRRSAIEENITPAGAKSGPLTTVIRKSTGDEFSTFFLGQPPRYPLRQHLLMVSVLPTLMQTI